MPEGRGGDSRAAAKKFQEAISSQDDAQGFQGPTPILRDRPAAHLAETKVHSPGVGHLPFHCAAKLAGHGRTSHGGVPHPQVVKTGSVAFLQITQAGTNLSPLIERKYVPTAIID